LSRAYRDNGHAAYDPKTLLGVLLYAYRIGVCSCRQIERRCTEDLAFRVLAANQLPDHVTIARFRVRHQTALAGLLVVSLKLCAAGMVRVGTVALDGTSSQPTPPTRPTAPTTKLDAEVLEILRQAAEVDRDEDRGLGDAHGTSCSRRWRAGPGGWTGCASQGPAGGRGGRAPAGLPAAAAARQKAAHAQASAAGGA
jgi:hypothetical protein